MNKILTLYSVALLAPVISAAQPGNIDLSFNPGTGADGYSIEAIAVQPTDGRIIVGGAFGSFNGTTCNNLVRLEQSGDVDLSFLHGVGTNDDVRCITLLPDGKLMIGGLFTTFNGAAVNGVMRLNADGSLDPAFAPTVSFIFTDAIAIQPDGKYLIAAVGLARLTATGELDPSFSHQFGLLINAVVIQPDGKILIGGGFDNWAGTPRSGIARLHPDGSLDMTFDPGSGTDFPVETVALLPSGKILIGGGFQLFNGQPHEGIVRLNSDGSYDSTFGPVNEGATAVYSISVQADERIVIGGIMGSYDGVEVDNICRLQTNGLLDMTFRPGTEIGTDFPVYSTTLQPDGKVLIGGVFTTYDSVDRNHIARLSNDPVGIPEIRGDSIALYPNPFTDGTTVRSEDGKPIRVVLYDPQGRLVHDKVLNGETYIDLQGLANGTYTAFFWKELERIHKVQLIKQ